MQSEVPLTLILSPLRYGFTLAQIFNLQCYPLKSSEPAQIS